jgi:hypothetical protein
LFKKGGDNMIKTPPIEVLMSRVISRDGGKYLKMCAEELENEYIKINEQFVQEFYDGKMRDYTLSDKLDDELANISMSYVILLKGDDVPVFEFMVKVDEMMVAKLGDKHIRPDSVSHHIRTLAMLKSRK